MMASSLLLYGRRLCIIMAVTFLLFLPLTFNANNNALLQSQSVFAQVQEEEAVGGTEVAE